MLTGTVVLGIYERFYMRIGYACKTVGVQNTQIKKCVLRNATDEKLKEIICKNLDALINILSYNIENDIRLFRISSDIIPFASHPVNQIKWWDEYRSELRDIGKMIRSVGMRVSMHPGQYTVLNSPNVQIVNRAISELAYHTRFLDALDLNAEHKIILHVGGSYGDKQRAAKRFEKNFCRLTQKAQARVVVENDEKCFDIQDVLQIGSRLNIPVVFDMLHHQIKPGKIEGSECDIIEKCAATWEQKDGEPKVHYSQQRIEARAGMHSPTIFVDEFLSFYHQVQDIDVDIMLEVKDKNLSTIKCMHCINENLHIKALEQAWAKYKYSVLEKSPTVYQAIRELLKNKKVPQTVSFYRDIEQAIYKEVNNFGHQENAALHVWGYFAKMTTEQEKKRFFALINKASNKSAKNFLKKLALKYQMDYLLHSYYFDINQE